jgi:hypothetical protein
MSLLWPDQSYTSTPARNLALSVLLPFEALTVTFFRI